jgi:uncharacterized protein (TIGR02118 family)
MYRLTILYGTPEDPEAFDRYYRETHIPIASRMQGLTGWNLTWTQQQTGDVAPPVHLVVDLLAEDKEAMDAILASEEGRAASADVPKFATGGVTFLSGTEERVPLA